jgi:hypothetical protein
MKMGKTLTVLSNSSASSAQDNIQHNVKIKLQWEPYFSKPLDCQPPPSPCCNKKQNVSSREIIIKPHQQTDVNYLKTKEYQPSTAALQVNTKHHSCI